MSDEWTVSVPLPPDIAQHITEILEVARLALNPYTRAHIAEQMDLSDEYLDEIQEALEAYLGEPEDEESEDDDA